MRDLSTLMIVFALKYYVSCSAIYNAATGIVLLPAANVFDCYLNLNIFRVLTSTGANPLITLYQI